VRAQQTTLDEAPAQQPAAETPKKRIDFFTCECGLEMSRATLETNEGKCLRCERTVSTDATSSQREIAPNQNGGKVPAPADDPWQLKPESQVAKSDPTAPETRVSDKPAGKKEQPMGGEVPMTELVVRLGKAGYSATLQDVASMNALVRADLGKAMKDPGHDPAEETKAWLRAHKGLPPQDTNRVTVDTDAATGETVSYTWGEEKITPVRGEFSTCTVGAFTSTTKVRPGETRADALARLAAEVSEFAETERTRKLGSFVRAMRGLKEQLKQEAN
jgi:hypothetical protein